jgi:hypothetical protein
MSELENHLSPQTAPSSVISSPESPLPPITVKHANPITEADSVSNDDHDMIRHRTLYLV